MSTSAWKEGREKAMPELEWMRLVSFVYETSAKSRAYDDNVVSFVYNAQYFGIYSECMQLICCSKRASVLLSFFVVC